MTFACRSVFLSLLILVTTVPLAWTGPSATEGAALNEEQRTGRRLFAQNCGLCHSPVKKNNKNPSDEGTTIGPRLNGLFSGPKALTDAVAKTFIEKGVPNKMPGFQYSLEPKEVDAILAYLKTL